MKIVDLKAEALSFPLQTPFWNGRGERNASEGGRRFHARSTVLVRVFTDEGIVGIGEAGLAGAPPAVVAAAIEHHVKPLVIGEDALQIERLWHKVYGFAGASGRRGVLMLALSGLDIALWDILGKALNAPIHRLLGTYRDRIPAYASAGFYEEGKGIEELVEAAKGYIAEGFGAVKMKIGALPIGDPIGDDAARVEAVREAIGPERRLMVDANSAYTVKTALQVAERLEDVGLEWFEEPVWVDDVAGSARLAAAIEVPVAGYETEFGLFGFRDLIVNHAVDVVQPDIAWTGGFTECRRIAAFAAAYDLPCSPHCFSSALTIAASLHLAASIPNAGWLEFDRMPNGLRDELLTKPLAVDAEGYVAVPDGPGLGIELNEDTVAKYRVEAGGSAPRRSGRRRPGN